MLFYQPYSHISSIQVIDTKQYFKINRSLYTTFWKTAIRSFWKTVIRFQMSVNARHSSHKKKKNAVLGDMLPR